MPTRYDLDEHGKIRPDPEDFDAVKETPDDPLKTMREMEKLAERSRGG